MSAFDKDLASLSGSEKQQLASILSILILHEEKKDVSAATITKLCKAANIDVPASLPTALVNSLGGKSVESFLNFSSGAAAAPAKAEAKVEEKKDDKKAPKKEEKKPEPEEDMDLGGMFD